MAPAGRLGALDSIFRSADLDLSMGHVDHCSLTNFVFFGLFARDLKSHLSFEDEIDGVIFIDRKRNEIIPVRDYDFSEKLHETLSAVNAESRSICLFLLFRSLLLIPQLVDEQLHSVRLGEQPCIYRRNPNNTGATSYKTRGR